MEAADLSSNDVTRYLKVQVSIDRPLIRCWSLVRSSIRNNFMRRKLPSNRNLNTI
jgi:hypothetical protein